MFRYAARLKGIALATILAAVVFSVSGCSASLTIVIPLEEEVADALDDLVSGMKSENLDRVMARYLTSYTSESLSSYSGRTDYELLQDEMQDFFYNHTDIDISVGTMTVQNQSPSTVVVYQDWTVTASPDAYATARGSEGSQSRGVVTTPNPVFIHMWFRMVKQNGMWFIVSDSMPDLLYQF